MAMSMGTGGESGDPEVMSEMNTTPLIDVMLVLLIMLIITIPIQTNSVKLDLPAGNPPPPPVPPPVVTIDVDFDGTVLWDGTQVNSEDDLEGRMRNAAAQNPQPEVHLRPNKLATYKYVAHVMADAQRLGLTTLGIVGNEQFVNGN
jgi:biopolymer transport protein ExbD